MDFQHKIGMRNIKTTVAVLFCLIIGYLFRREAFYSSIAAVICIQPTLDQTFQTGVNRILGTIAGGMAGFIALEAGALLPAYEQWMYLLLVPLFVMLLIYVLNVLHMPGAISICCVVFLGIATNFEREVPDTLLYVVDRILDTTVGIGLAMVVNKYLGPPVTEQKKEEDGDPPKAEK